MRTHTRNKGGVPKTNLLAWIPRPNGAGGVGYVLPASLAATLGDGLFFTGGVPDTKTPEQILAGSETNRGTVLFKGGRLAVYHPTAASLRTLLHAHKTLNIPFVLETVDTSGNRIIDGSGNIITSSRF